MASVLPCTVSRLSLDSKPKWRRLAAVRDNPEELQPAARHLPRTIQGQRAGRQPPVLFITTFFLLLFWLQANGSKHSHPMYYLQQIVTYMGRTA